MMFLSVALSASFIAALVSAETIRYCGTQPYYPSQYTCYNGFLCPVVSGERTLKCGSACYLPEAYTCTNGQLAQHPPIQHPFELAAKNTITALNGKKINACGRNFFVGQGTCTYCPIADCRMFTNTTILYGGGSAMDVQVSGGQATYVESNGAFGFTQAHSMSIPAGARQGAVSAYDAGYLIPTQGTGWTACPSQPASADYQIFAKLPGVPFIGTCVDLNIVTNNKPDGTVGAWQYS